MSSVCVTLGCHPLTPALEFIEKLGKDVRKLDTVWDEDVIQMETEPKGLQSGAASWVPRRS